MITEIVKNLVEKNNNHSDNNNNNNKIDDLRIFVNKSNNNEKFKKISFIDEGRFGKGFKVHELNNKNNNHVNKTQIII